MIPPVKRSSVYATIPLPSKCLAWLRLLWAPGPPCLAYGTALSFYADIGDVHCVRQMIIFEAVVLMLEYFMRPFGHRARSRFANGRTQKACEGHKAIVP